MARGRNSQRGAISPVSARRRSRRARTGFSIVEVLVAIVILTVAVCGVSGSMISALTLNRVNRETAIAEAAVRRMMEQASDVTFADAFATFNANPNDDPAGAGTAQGPNFAVFGLTPNADDADGLVGDISFPTIDVGGVAQLREDVVDPALGMPRDLNGDGIDALDHSADYRVLPIRVRVQWRGLAGPRSLVAESMLAAR